MIKSFADRATEKTFKGEFVRSVPQDIRRRAQRKLVTVDAAAKLSDLESPPSNRLEALRGDRKGQFSIRVNQQWRICFVWTDGDAYEVELVDYH